MVSLPCRYAFVIPSLTSEAVKAHFKATPEIKTAAATDRAIAFMYLPGIGHWVYSHLEAKRSDCTMVNNFTRIHGTEHTRLTFISDNKKPQIAYIPMA